LKEEALHRTIWRHRFGGGFGPVVRQNTEWMNERCILLVTYIDGFKRHGYTKIKKNKIYTSVISINSNLIHPKYYFFTYITRVWYNIVFNISLRRVFMLSTKMPGALQCKSLLNVLVWRLRYQAPKLSQAFQVMTTANTCFCSQVTPPRPTFNKFWLRFIRKKLFQQLTTLSLSVIMECVM